MQAAAGTLLRRTPPRSLAAGLRAAASAGATSSSRSCVVSSTGAVFPAAHRLSNLRALPPCRGFSVGAAGGQGRTVTPSSWLAALRTTAARAAASVGKGLPPAFRPGRRASLPTTPAPPPPPGTAARVAALHADAFWQAHGPKVVGLAAILATYGAWRVTSALHAAVSGGAPLSPGQTLVSAAAAVTLVGGASAALRARYALSPDTVYRAALARLNADPGVLELLGAPLAGSPARALVQTGGGLRLGRAGAAPGRSFLGLPLPAPRPRRVQMVFPLAGPSRRGLAAVEAKKRGGRLVFRVLAVDVPVERAGVPLGLASSPGGAPSQASPFWEHRIFLEGDDAAYGRGGVFAALRGPFSQALALRRSHDEEDDLDDAADAAAVAAAARADAAAAVLAGGGAPLAGPSWWWLRKKGGA